MANITLMGASYSDVPAVDLPATGGGTARFHEVSGSQSITTNGTYDVTTKAEVVVNVSGGGGTTISTAGDYSLSPGDTITMGTGLSGDLTAYGARVLENSWDFTQSLTDSVGGLSVTLANSATRTSDGITIAGSTQYATVPLRAQAGKTYEVDFGALTKSFTSGHGRVFMWTSGDGLCLQSGSNWNIYSSGQWNTFNNGGNVSAFSGKTLRICTIPVESYGNGADKGFFVFRFYVDGVKWFFPTVAENPSNITANTKITLGSSSASFNSMVITGMRVYSGVRV